MTEIVQFLALSYWLILFSIIFTRSIHVVANDGISLCGRVVFHSTYVSYLLFPVLYRRTLWFSACFFFKMIILSLNLLGWHWLLKFIVSCVQFYNTLSSYCVLCSTVPSQVSILHHLAPFYPLLPLSAYLALL